MYKVGDWVRNNKGLKVPFTGDTFLEVSPDSLGLVEFLLDPGEENEIGVRWIEAGGKGMDFIIAVRNEDVRKQNIGFDAS